MVSSSEYYAYFDSNTNNGVVFDCNLCALRELPQKELTNKEKKERKEWLRVRRSIVKKYQREDSPPVTNTGELLEQRILAPCLVTKAASSRSKPAEGRAGRRYPEMIAEWTHFKQAVTEFQPDEKSFSFAQPPFMLSATLGDPSLEIRDERQEELFLLNFLNLTLHKKGLIGKLVSHGAVVGRPDAMATRTGVDVDDPSDDGGDISESDDQDDDKGKGGGEETKGDDDEENEQKNDEFDDNEDDEDDMVDDDEDDDEEDTSPGIDDVGLLCEFKSTHNLALPMSATRVCQIYNAAYQDVYVARNGRTEKWSRVCHPIGQLLGYMVDNSKRFGALSTGTRTYFLRITPENGKEVVQISDAIFVGQEGYLKAWVYAFQLQSDTPLDKDSLDWKKTSRKVNTPPQKPSRTQPKRGGGGQSGGPPSKTVRLQAGPSNSGAAEMSTSLMSVPLSELKVIRALGQGRNGTVFLAEWNGQEVALKQFDVDKSGLAFEKEVEAYVSVENAWGRLVPRPFFVSESWSGGTRFLALQVGRMPRTGDDTSNWRSILAALENEFGLRHEDCDGRRNLLFIPHGKSEERLVVVDLEEVTWINDD